VTTPFDLVPRQAFAIFVSEAQSMHRRAIAGVRALAIPAQGLGKIRHRASSRFLGEAQNVHRAGVAVGGNYQSS